MRDPVDTIEKDGFTAKLYIDDAESPKSWDQFGTLVTWHRNYVFDEDGKKAFGEPSDFIEQAKREKWIYLPVFMYEHSGISLSSGSFGDPWDSGQVGFIYVTREKMKEEYEKHFKPRSWAGRARKLLRVEIHTWDQYVTGDVYGYVIENEDGDHDDSCWGFYGYEYAKAEMRAALDSAIEGERAANAFCNRDCAL